VHAARLIPGTGLWQEATVAGPGVVAREPRVAVGRSGDAVVVWYLDGSYRIEASRFDSQAGTWGPATDLGAGVAPDVGVDDAGNAIVVWSAASQPGQVQAARYAAVAGSWGAPVALIDQGLGAWEARVVVDASGNATAAWTQLEAGSFKTLYSGRYDAAAATWAAAVPLRSVYSLSSVDGKSLNGHGDVALLWSEPWWVYQRRYVAATGTWTSATSVGLPPICASAPAAAPACHSPQRAGDLTAALDPRGNTFGAWHLIDGRIQVARFAADPASAPALLVHPLLHSGWSPAIAVAPWGTATALWGTAGGVMSSQWVAAPKPPLIAEVTSGDGSLSIRFAPPETAEAALAPFNYEYSLDDGRTWIARAPAWWGSPLVLTGLAPGWPYRLRLRAVNAAGAGAPSGGVTATPGPIPGPPTDLAAVSIAGRIVTLSWLAPVNSTAPSGYVIEGGSRPGEVLATVPTGAGATTLQFTAPQGVFFARVHAVADGRRSLPSNEVRLVVDVPEAPSAPASVLGLVSGSGLALSWTNTFTGGAPTGVRLEVMGSLTGSLQLPLRETVQFPAVPPGTYTVRLVATNASGSSPPSSAVTLTVPGGCSGVPGVPTRVAATKAGATVTLAWSPPEDGAAVTGYQVTVSGSYSATFATPARSVAGAVGPGSYTLRVAAVNPCGASAASPALTVTVP
jgi:hypothetical protein